MKRHINTRSKYMATLHHRGIIKEVRGLGIKGLDLITIKVVIITRGQTDGNNLVRQPESSSVIYILSNGTSTQRLVDGR